MPDLRLALPAAALWLTCLLVVAVPEAAGAVGLGCALVAALSIVVALRRGPGRRGWGARVALIVVGAALGATSIAVQAPGRIDEALTDAARAGKRLELTMRVDGAPHRLSTSGFDGLPRWSLRATTVGEHAGVPLTAMLPSSEAQIRGATIGSIVRVAGRLRPTEPGEATSYLLSASTPAGTVAPAPPWLGWTAPIRGAFAAAAARTPGDGGALLPGLAIGDESAVSSALDTAMKESALSHLTAVSGANCALVTGLVFALAAFAGLGRRSRIVVAGASLAAFVLLVGPGASVLRAAAMAAVVLLALARGRPSEGIPALALAAIVLLVHDPWLARDYGFVLSVLATAGLLVLAGPLSRALARWMPRSLALAIAVPLAAQLACQPVLVLLTPTLPLYGVPANLLAEPAAPLATVLGCIACLLLPWAPALGQAAVWVAWLPSVWIAQVAVRTSTLPASSLPWIGGPLGVGLCALALVAVAILVRRTAPNRALALTAALGLIAGGAVYAGALGGGAIGSVLAVPGDWRIAACDVGQGDAILLRDGDRIAMIDVGREPEPARACLDRLSVGRLDFLLLTHYDVDHIGGLAGVLGKVQRVIAGAPARDADTRVLGIIAAAGVPVDQGRAGMSGTLGSTAWRILWPPEPAPGLAPLTGNAGSVTLEAEGGGIRSLHLGDLGESAQDALLATGSVRPVDVVKMAHHGSSDQSPRLYAALHASLALVSVGAENRYGHPTAKALHLLRDAGTAAARTDTQGMLLVSRASDGLRVWSPRAADAAAGGRTYPGYGRGGTWRPEVTAEPARERRAQQARSRSSRGTRSCRRRSSSYRGPRDSWPTALSEPSVTASGPRIPASRSATSRRRTTRRASCSRSRAPPCSGSPA